MITIWQFITFRMFPRVQHVPVSRVQGNQQSDSRAEEQPSCKNKSSAVIHEPQKLYQTCSVVSVVPQQKEKNVINIQLICIFIGIPLWRGLGCCRVTQITQQTLINCAQTFCSVQNCTEILVFTLLFKFCSYYSHK